MPQRVKREPYRAPYSVADEIDSLGHTQKIKIDQKLLDAIPLARAVLIHCALAGKTITYGNLSVAMGRLIHYQSMGPLMDLMTVENDRLGEPLLASLIVKAGTGETGDDWDITSNHAERQNCYAKNW